MLRDVFYYGNKPNVHPREQFAENLADARLKATTHDFWIINEFCDYRNFDWDFDFEFLPDEDVWAEDHNNVWPSQHQKDSGTWLCPKDHSDLIIYRGDVDPVIRKNEKNDNWVELELINHAKFDFSWHPDPTNPPYIYKWPCKFFPAEFKHVLEYRVPGATQEKYMNVIAELMPEHERWVEHQLIDKDSFDLSWRPSPLDPPFIYVWGNKYVDGTLKPTLEYHAPDAVDKKYMSEHVAVLPEWDKWVEVQEVDKKNFDFSWRPDPREPAYIYTWGNKYIAAEDRPTLEYHCDGAVERKYMDEIVPVLPEWDRWKIVQKIDMNSFDFSWRPDPKEPPFTYVFGNELYDAVKMPTIIYNMPDGPEIKYIDNLKAKLAPNIEKFRVLIPIDNDSFDFTWLPDPDQPPYIYTWGNQWNSAEIEPTVEFHVEGATQRKFMDTRVTVLPDTSCWVEVQEIDKSKFDFSWRPDPTSPPYIYIWGNKYIDAELKPTLEYRCEGASERKYMTNDVIVLPEWDRWVEVQEIDKTKFDFTWRPDPREPDYIYTWGNKYIDAELKPTIEYRCQNATERKYMTNDVIVLPEWDRWVEVQEVDKSKFDFTWRPDPREPDYIYTWGNKWIDAELRPTLEYHCKGATERKYTTNDVAVMPESARWKIEQKILPDSFDFTWRPDPREPAYTYVFGNDFYDAIKMPTVIYNMPGGTEIKYIHDITAKLAGDKSLYEHLEDAELEDYSWLPDPDSPPYIYAWGNQWNKPEDKISVQYVVPGATDYRYMEERAIRKPSRDCWEVPANLVVDAFDFSWEPNPNDPPYIYEFGTQHQKTDGPKYVVEGATETKYIDIPGAIKLPSRENWKIIGDIAANGFDFSWHPDSTSPPYIYVFGNKWNQAVDEPTVEYHAPNATQVTYVDDISATLLPDMKNWVIPDNVDTSGFDFSWRPNPHSPPYIYEFGTQWQKTGGPRYAVEGATTVKYEDALTAKILPDNKNFVTLHGMNISSFDYSWHPDSTEEPYIYVFGNQWFSAEKEPTIEYRMPGAIKKKYVTNLVATLSPDMTNWETPDNIDISNFDFSWHPDPDSPAYIYQFGTLQDPNDGPKYITPNNIGEIVTLPRIEIAQPEDSKLEVGQYYIETSLEDLVNQHPNEIFWAMRKSINYDDFDFSWLPNIEQAHYVHVFGSADSEFTQTYLVNAAQWLQGNRDFNWVENIELTDNTLVEMFVKPDMFFVDRSNPESAARFEALKAKYGTRIQKTRYLNSWVDTINRCINRATTELLWVLNSELDYSDFNFEYYPNPWQMQMVQVFGTQWSHWGTTFMVNRETFREDTKYIKIIEHLSNLNFVKDIRAKSTKCVHDIVVVDHGNREATEVVKLLQSKATDRNITVIKYDTSYLNTFKDIIKRQPEKKEHFIWVCSSVCDYTNFDFTYIIDPFARDNLHVFPSGKQKFGDTFFIDVNNAREIIGELEQLENFTKVSYNSTVRAERLLEPIIVISDDTHTNSVDKITDFPYATLITSDNVDIGKADIEPMNLWSTETKNIYVTSTGATRIVVPKEAKDHVKKELYEYPYIKRAPKLALSKPLDIVFLSNGETGAEENYEHLLNITKNLPNRVVRVDGINGRAAAYHAAAEASETPWMFTVFAKLKISPKFDFNWQPDRMQSPKHYIFHAKNPVNGLIYGHQAMIAYNKKLTLANDGKGLDFTLDNEHEVVPLISGTAQYNTDEFSTWRTAFREVIKLRSDDSEVSRERFDAWLNKAEGDFAQYSIKGALDADAYYDEVDGDFDKLKLSYEWSWLKEKFDEI